MVTSKNVNSNTSTYLNIDIVLIVLLRQQRCCLWMVLRGDGRGITVPAVTLMLAQISVQIVDYNKFEHRCVDEEHAYLRADHNNSTVLYYENKVTFHWSYTNFTKCITVTFIITSNSNPSKCYILLNNGRLVCSCWQLFNRMNVVVSKDDRFSRRIFLLMFL